MVRAPAPVIIDPGRTGGGFRCGGHGESIYSAALPERAPTAASGPAEEPGAIDRRALREVADLAALAVGDGPRAQKRLEEAREVVRRFGELVQLEPTTGGDGADRPPPRAGAAPCRLRPDAPTPGFPDGTVADLAPARARRLVRTPSVLTG